MPRDLELLTHDGAESAVGSADSLGTSRTFWTAEERQQAQFSRCLDTTIADDKPGDLVSVATTYYSMQDPAIHAVKNKEDFRVVFADLDVSKDVHMSSSNPIYFGGQADVKQGECSLTAQTVAVKFVRSSSTEADVYRRLAREIGIWRDLSRSPHPNILPLIGLYWSTTTLPAMVSPWCGNGNAISYIKARQSEPNLHGIRLQLLQDTLNGLAYLHSLMVVHGDLKGANVLVSDDGTACLGDFGISTVLQSHPARTATGAGTYRWMAPELLSERGAFTRASDIWAMGCVILELSVLKPPYNGLLEPQAIIAIGKGAPPPRQDGVHDDLWELCEDCFQVSNARPSANALHLELVLLNSSSRNAVIRSEVRDRLVDDDSNTRSKAPASPLNSLPAAGLFPEIICLDLEEKKRRRRRRRRTLSTWCVARALTTVSIASKLVRHGPRFLIYPAAFYPEMRTEIVSPELFELPYEIVQLCCSDGVTIEACVMVQHPPRPAPTIFMFHGNGANYSMQLPLARNFYRQMQCNVFMLSYRGYGKSQGTPTEKGLRLDAQAGLDYILSHDVLSKSKLILYGQSLGGAVALDLARGHPDKMSALILENTFLSIPEMIPALSVFCMQKWNSKRTITLIPPSVPMLFLSGLQDEVVPCSHMERLHEIASDPKSGGNCSNRFLKKFPDGTHNDTFLHPGFWTAVLQFVQCVRQ